MKTINLIEYWEMLNAHDWYFAWSDDARVFNNGDYAYERLKKLASGNKEFDILLKGFHNHYFSGEPWGTEQTTKPEKPTGETENDCW